MTEIEILKRKLAREIAARKQAEQILEHKALELFETNQKLRQLNESLEDQVEKRSADLLKNEQKYRSILENMELGILEVDSNGIITKAYPRFCDLIGYKKEELLGSKPEDLFLLPEYIDVISAKNIERNAGTSSVYEIQLRKKNGEVIWVMISGAPITNTAGEVVGSIGLHYDITEQKRLRANLQRAKMMAENAQRAEQNFLSNMSHEIRTPLNAIVGMSHLLNDTSLNQQQQEYLDILQSSANVLLALISDILDLSRIDAGTIEVQSKPFNLPALATFIENTFTLKLEDKPVNFILDIDNRIDHMLVGDELLMSQILLNLVGNASKFTKTGFVKLVIKCLEINDKIVKIGFIVEDTGIGISSEKLKLIFEDFKQASSDITREFGGTGLGLAITKKLIQLLGGEIKVASTLNKGSKFWFDLTFENTQLPLNKPRMVIQKDFKIVGDIAPVLVVEDNKMNLLYITKLLQKWKIQYDVAMNGQEAIKYTDEKPYSLIFMDIQMPILNGYEATIHIRKYSTHNKETNIVALTASTLLAKKQKALDFGMTDYLAKPFRPEQLAEIIMKYLKNIEIENVDFKAETTPQKNVLDEALLDATYGSDYAYAIDMFETFLQLQKEDIAKLSQYISDKNIDEAAALAHKIKPTFTMVGLPDLTIQMEELEHIAKQNNIETLKEKFLQFERQLTQTVPVIKAALSNYKAKL